MLICIPKKRSEFHSLQHSFFWVFTSSIYDGGNQLKSFKNSRKNFYTEKTLVNQHNLIWKKISSLFLFALWFTNWKSSFLFVGWEFYWIILIWSSTTAGYLSLDWMSNRAKKIKKKFLPKKNEFQTTILGRLSRGRKRKVIFYHKKKCKSQRILCVSHNLIKFGIS